MTDPLQETTISEEKIISGLEAEKEKVKEFVKKIYKEPVLIPKPKSVYLFEVNQ